MISFSIAGLLADLLGDIALSDPALTDVDVSELISATKASPVLHGHRGATPVHQAAPPISSPASVLADDMPEIASWCSTPNAHPGVEVLGVEISWPRLPDGPIRVGVRSREVGHNGSVTRTTDANLFARRSSPPPSNGRHHPAIVSTWSLAALGRARRRHLVHQGTTFRHGRSVARITVLGLTESRLLIVHADDHQDDPHGRSTWPPPRASRCRCATCAASSHACPTRRTMCQDRLGRELTLTLGWGPSSVLTSSRVVARIPDVTPTTASTAPSPPMTSLFGSRPTPTARSH